jgi:pyruvate/2-oxoglutarate dehydrogenase complex dihydrolipoamide acyltransferase (E2) component
MTISPIARERRHTLLFLNEIRNFAPVFLDTEIDMTGLLAHKASSHRRYSVVSYVLWAGARVLLAHPEANTAIRGRLRPRIARYPSVSGKVTFDKTLNGHRIVMSSVLPDLEHSSLDQIQNWIEALRDGDPGTQPEFAVARIVHGLPLPLGLLGVRLGVRPLRRRAATFGTLAVTSLGHRPVDSFHSVGGTTITLGIGQIADRPVVREGELAIAPVLRLSLSFDHRVIDGAEAADILTELRTMLEALTELRQSSASVP